MKPLIVITGATASGKTSLSISLARKLNAEILSVDSVQIYKKLDIGSAKPSQAELQSVKHHLINTLEPNVKISAAEFSKMSTNLIEDLQKQNKQVLVVGGSTLYLTALLYGLADLPECDPKIRLELESKSNQDLYNSLVKKDPVRAAEIHENDRFRLIRALEILESFTSVSSEYRSHNFSELKFPAIILVLCRTREELYELINKRTKNMLDAGLIDEVKQIIDEYGLQNVPALNSLGYSQTVEYLDKNITKEQLYEKISQQTRRYAKRQLTFWRNEPIKKMWRQSPMQGEGDTSLQKSSYQPNRKSQELKDFNVLSYDLESLSSSLLGKLSNDFSGVEVWYLNANDLF